MTARRSNAPSSAGKSPSPPSWEIAPSSEFYDYEAKYISGSSGLYIPARIEEPVSNRIRETAVPPFQAMGCSGWPGWASLSAAAGEVLLNELNTLPGFTSISMYPKLMGPPAWLIRS